MYWIALLPLHEGERVAWGWHALRFTPRVAWVDEALLLEASASLRLWGGRKALLTRLLRECAPLAPAPWAQGSAGLVALGLLRLKLRSEHTAAPALSSMNSPHDLPLDVLSAAHEHVATLQRMGCRSWGDLRALPRAGVARRFGAPVLEALDMAFGERPEVYPWLTLPEAFDMKFELLTLATSAPELMECAHRLLAQLQVWLQARHQGVLAIELEWTLDLKRHNGVRLPTHEQLAVRSAVPTQDITHLRRLVAEHLSRTGLSAPASYLRLRSLETQAMRSDSQSLLPQDRIKGERLHQLVERLRARLGQASVRAPVQQADHRPEHMQRWVPTGDVPRGAPAHSASGLPCDALYPPWLLPAPLRLEVRGEKPHYHGPLRLLAGPQRLETGWWDGDAPGPALRDYFIARSEQAGLLWVYRERLTTALDETAPSAPVRWYLHGVYA